MRSSDRWLPKSTRFPLLVPVIQVITGLAVVWAGARTTELGSAPIGVLLFAVGGITTALAARQLINSVRSPDSGFEASGKLPKDQFDYIVWTAVGVPIVLVLALLVFVLTGSR